MPEKTTKRAVVCLMHIFNACIRFVYCPTLWKSAKIIPILKPLKPFYLSSRYRHVSLFINMGKIFEKARLSEHVDSNEKEQFCFRQKHSTTYPLLRVKTEIKLSISAKRSMDTVSFNTEKAFDRVWHKGLLYKLILLMCSTASSAGGHLRSPLTIPFLSSRRLRPEFHKDQSYLHYCISFTLTISSGLKMYNFCRRYS